MPGLAPAAKDAMLDTLGRLAAFASLHEKDPGVSGAGEVFGGAYKREPLTWSPSSSATKSSTMDLHFDVPASVTIRFLGYWSAAGTFLGSRPLNEDQAYATAGTYTVPAGAVIESLT